MMKKLLALLLVLLTLTFGGVAGAEDLTAAIEGAFDGCWLQFDDGFEMYLPAEWLVVDVTEEMLNAGIFYVVCSPDGANTVQMAWKALPEETDINVACAELATVYPNAEVKEVNGIPMIWFTDDVKNIMGIVAMDAAEPGMYMFFLTPNADEEFAAIGAAIACSIRNIAD